MSSANHKRISKKKNVNVGSKNRISEPKTLKEELSQIQIKELEEELIKFPNPSIYYKKKISLKFSKLFDINDKIILNWLNENGRSDSVKDTDGSKASPTIKNLSISEKKVTELEEKCKKQDSNDNFDSMYEKLKKDYEEKVKLVKKFETQIPNMISEFKKFVNDMEANHKKSLIDKEEELQKAREESKKLPKNMDNPNIENKLLEAEKKIKTLESKLKKEATENEGNLAARKKQAGIVKELQEKKVELEKHFNETEKKLAKFEAENRNLKIEMEKETSALKKKIEICRKEVESAKKIIKSSTKDISDRNTLISDLKKNLSDKDAFIEKKLDEIKELKSEKETLINSTDFNQLKEKVKEKEYCLLKLRNNLYEKELILADKDTEIQRLSERISHLIMEHENSLEKRAFEDINNQNNIRHQLLSQQFEMKKLLMDEHTNIVTNLQNKIQRKKDLLMKVKQMLVYKPSTEYGLEKTNIPHKKLSLTYSWPLDLYLGPVFTFTEDLKNLLRDISIKTLKRNLGTFRKTSETLKRKSEDDIFSTKFKKQKTIQVFMISYCWPIVPYYGNREILPNQPKLSPKRKSFANVDLLKKKMRILSDIPCYSYKTVNNSSDSNSLQSDKICSQKKLKIREYKAPLIKKIDGRKRSFLDFLEDLSPDEMQDVNVTDDGKSVLDHPVIIVKPKSRRLKFTTSPLLDIVSQSFVSERRMTNKLLNEAEFMSNEEIVRSVASHIIQSLLVEIVCRK